MTPGAWPTTGLPDNASVNALAIDPTTPRTLYAGEFNRGGVFKSTDAGSTWNTLNTGLPNTFVVALAIAPSTPPALYAATSGGVYNSTDGGDSWSAANTGLPDNASVNALAIDPTTPQTLYAATTDGLTARVYKSTDGGDTWNAAYTGLPDHVQTVVNALAIDPTTPGTLYTATGVAGDCNYGYPCNVAGLYKSTDGGDTWNAADIGLPGNNTVVIELAIDPNPPGTLYAAPLACRHNYGCMASGVYKSTDGASSWQAFNAGLSNTSVLALALARTTPSTLYAGTGGGVFAIAQVPPSCVGDCSGTATVAIDDLVTLVNIALGTAQPSACPNGGLPLGGEVDVAVIIQAVNNALNGCGSRHMTSRSDAMRRGCHLKDLVIRASNVPSSRPGHNGPHSNGTSPTGSATLPIIRGCKARSNQEGSDEGRCTHLVYRCTSENGDGGGAVGVRGGVEPGAGGRPVLRGL